MTLVSNQPTERNAGFQLVLPLIIIQKGLLSQLFLTASSVQSLCWHNFTWRGRNCTFQPFFLQFPATLVTTTPNKKYVELLNKAILSSVGFICVSVVIPNYLPKVVSLYCNSSTVYPSHLPTDSTFSLLGHN